ncbi:MAG TPA: DUF4364 family protein [Candidatus Limiplasma sp.]|nr:DUF4364 family protein [Candidatus Limiplasma sp.]
MPIKPAPRNISETEYMLRLLRCVDVLDCVTELSLWTFVAELELMDYVTMRLCLHKLLTAEQVEYGAGTMKNHLYLTPKGRQALSLFGDRLPSEISAKITAAAPAFRERISVSQQVHAAYEMAQRNDYRLILSVSEGDLRMLEIRMHVKSRRLAGRAIKLFEAQAPKVTLYLYQQAQSAQTDEAKAAPAAGEIVRHSTTEFEARHTLTCKRAQLAIALTLPSEQAAAAYLSLFDDTAMAAETADKLCKLICAIHI